jgi:hypothetical protein
VSGRPLNGHSHALLRQTRVFVELLQRLLWEEGGDCFKCERPGGVVTHLGVIEGPAGPWSCSPARRVYRLSSVLDGSYRVPRRPSSSHPLFRVG